MTDTIVRWPIIPVIHFDRDFVEQRFRETHAYLATSRNESPPHRTRPLLVVDNEKAFSR